MTRVAIVGTSKLTELERDNASAVIESILNSMDLLNDCLITGDAVGVDVLVYNMAYNIPNFKILRVFADEKYWEGERGFKARNMRIARESDIVYSITTKTKTIPCYHCNQDHERTGGCWTRKYAESLGKEGSLIIV